MITVTEPKRDRNVIKLPPLDPSKVKRGHSAHRGGAGTHHDRRTKRLRTRASQRNEALSE